MDLNADRNAVLDELHTRFSDGCIDFTQNYENEDFMEAIGHWIEAGKPVCMATQVTHEGSDMEVYQVGIVIKVRFPVQESYDMTLEASVT